MVVASFLAVVVVVSVVLLKINWSSSMYSLLLSYSQSPLLHNRRGFHCLAHVIPFTHSLSHSRLFIPSLLTLTSLLPSFTHSGVPPSLRLTGSSVPPSFRLLLWQLSSGVPPLHAPSLWHRGRSCVVGGQVHRSGPHQRVPAGQWGAFGGCVA